MSGATIANEIHLDARKSGPLSLKGVLNDQRFFYCLSTLLFLAFWYWIVHLNVLGRGLCYPHEVLAAMRELAAKKLAGQTLDMHIWVSTRRVLIGFFLAVAAGIPLGFFMGVN